jgi:ABC-type phosphate transport system substrate-binding protein
MRRITGIVLVVAAALAVVPACMALVGCSGSVKAAQGSTCREQGKAIVKGSATCADAVAALERFVERSPECAAVLNDGEGAGVRCKGDGGTR